MTPSRRADLQQMLEQRHRELTTLVQTKVRGFREMDASDTTRRIEFSDDPAHEDIDFALVQMQSQTMAKISAALERLAVGEYGMCRDCEQDIAEKRLRALPFAERCTRCQESAESSEGRERRRPQRDAGFPPGTIADTMLTSSWR